MRWTARVELLSCTYNDANCQGLCLVGVRGAVTVILWWAARVVNGSAVGQNRHGDAFCMLGLLPAKVFTIFGFIATLLFALS